MGSLCIRDVIWQARNQSMHYEEDRARAPVVEVFSILEREQGQQFSLAAHSKQSRAKQVLEILGWRDYVRYLHDMQTLLE